jgi:hypothetical protein
VRSLDARLRRVERVLNRTRPCPCGGPYRVTVFDGVEPPPHPPHPCPRCGTFGKRIILADDPARPASAGGAGAAA